MPKAREIMYEGVKQEKQLKVLMKVIDKVLVFVEIFPSFVRMIYFNNCVFYLIVSDPFTTQNFRLFR